MKLLSIGNSFSQDAHRYLHELAKYNGIDLETVNLYIGGCNLLRHCACLDSGEAAYDLEPNGGEGIAKISLSDAVRSDVFDIVTVQQSSYDSGRPQTYFPYMEKLLSFCRESQPDAKLFFHQTWTYETDSALDAFADYDRDQSEMFRRIEDCTAMVKKAFGLPVIPTGAMIQRLRDTVPEFDYKNGGRSLCRDGGHLSFDYGRLTAAYTWLRSITGEAVTLKGFADFDDTLTEKIQAAGNQLFG